MQRKVIKGLSWGSSQPRLQIKHPDFIINVEKHANGESKPSSLYEGNNGFSSNVTEIYPHASHSTSACSNTNCVAARSRSG
jgi:hypothetical protein